MALVSARTPGGRRGSDQPPASDVAAFWDSQAAGYDHAYDAPGRAGRALRSRREAVLRLLGDGPGDVLDAGMGPGRLLLTLSERGWEVSGVDASEQMVALARRRVPGARERLMCASVERLPFPHSSFDAVVATGLLEYAGYAPRAISELARVLRPGGLAVLSVPNPWTVSLLWRRGLLYPVSRAVKRIAPFGRLAPLRRPRPPGRRQFEKTLATAGLATESLRPVRPAKQLVYGARKGSTRPGGRGAEIGANAGRPEFPPDYHHRIHEVEENHGWHRGMREISSALIEDQLRRGGRLLDVGCGTGGFLRWALERGAFEQAAGVDISAEAIELAKTRVPEAKLRVAPIWDLPFETASVDLIVLNDVLQHVPDTEVAKSLGEVRRLLRDDGELLVRTNGARRARSEGDWRVYDRATLRSSLGGAGFHCQRLTYANLAGSLLATARGSAPRSPSRDRHGIPSLGSQRANALIYGALHAEAGYLRRFPFGLPYGHTLFAIATPAELGAP